MDLRKSIGCGLIAALVGCTSEVRVFITDPPRGSQISGHAAVSLDLDADAETVTVTSGDSTFSAQVPAVVRVPAADGLGFASARIDSDPLIAVRSWQQGDFHPAGEFLEDAISVRLGDEALNGETSVSSLVEGMLRGQDLTRFVEHRLKLEFDLLLGDLGVKITPTKILAKDIAVSLLAKNSSLTLRAELSGVALAYEVDAGRFTAPGAAVIDKITLVSGVELRTTGASLIDSRVTASEPRITDGGRLPTFRVQLLAPLLREEIPPVFADAALVATDAVVAQLLANLRPHVGLAFAAPITQETRLRDVRPDGQSVLLRYDARVSPETPVRQTEHGFLLGPEPAHLGQRDATAAVGRSMMNQFAHAAWSAGNFDDIVFTKAELNDLGLPSLSFPYNRLRSVAVSLSLPPLFDWDGSGARAEFAGVEMRLDIRGAADMKAYTAARVPVGLCRQGRELRLCSDPVREIEVLDVELNQLNDLASRDFTVRLMRAASRGVVNRVLGSLPTVEVPILDFDGIDGAVSARVDPQVSAVDTAEDGWLFRLTLVDADARESDL